jgi:hypothetical protein
MLHSNELIGTAMGLFDFLRRPPPIESAEALADFVDENAAFLVQKGIYEYSRARAGPYSKMLMVEPAFVAAVNESRWKAYPLGLAMIAETVEGVLRPVAGEDRRAVVDALSAVVLGVFDRYPVPDPLGPDLWAQARTDLSHRLNLIGAHAPKAVKDIPEPMVQGYFDLMPIDERLRGRDFPSVRNYLRIGLINAHTRLIRRIDPAAVVADLLAAGR